MSFTRIVGSDSSGTGTNNNVQVSDSGALVVTGNKLNERETFLISYFINVSSTGCALLIDKSDTTNYPHTATNTIAIHSVTLKVDKTSNVLGNVGISLITDINATNSKIYAINETLFLQNTALTSPIESKKIFSTPVKCSIASLKPTKFITNDANLTYISANTGGPLSKPVGGTAIPAIGDILVNYALNAGTGFTALIEVEYSTE